MIAFSRGYVATSLRRKMPSCPKSKTIVAKVDLGRQPDFLPRTLGQAPARRTATVRSAASEWRLERDVAMSAVRSLSGAKQKACAQSEIYGFW